MLTSKQALHTKDSHITQNIPYNKQYRHKTRILERVGRIQK